jgi:hypothetical protein
MVWLPPANQSYSSAIECLINNSVKGGYSEKKMYEGRDINNAVNSIRYNVAPQEFFRNRSSGQRDEYQKMYKPAASDKAPNVQSSIYSAISSYLK